VSHRREVRLQQQVARQVGLGVDELEAGQIARRAEELGGRPGAAEQLVPQALGEDLDEARQQAEPFGAERWTRAVTAALG